MYIVVKNTVKNLNKFLNFYDSYAIMKESKDKNKHIKQKVEMKYK